MRPWSRGALHDLLANPRPAFIIAVISLTSRCPIILDKLLTMRDKASIALSPVDEKSRNQTAARAQTFSRLLIVLFLGLFTAVALGTIKNQSPPFDEPLHLLAGY